MSRPVAVSFAVLLLVAGLAGCGGPSPEKAAADKEEIQAFIEEYLPKLAEAYRTGDASGLEPYAAAKERSSIERRARELAKGGEVLAPVLESVEVEEVRSWQEINAYVTTIEVWDIRTYATGTENVVREQLAQTNRVKYQLQRENGRWRVFWREIQKTFE
jgi:hypothetical protein